MTSDNEDTSCPHGATLDDYVATSPLGIGSLGRVFEVHCRKCNKGFALKMVDKSIVHKRGLTLKLVNEIEIHQKLKHERVIELYRCFEDDECVYLLMELCKNGDLFTFLKSKGALPEAEARWLFKQIVEGVKYLHDNQIIHRDLKPTNILLTEQGNVKIGDFGVAVQLRELSEEHETMCGTANYLSPEIATKVPHGIETDIWSLGCILYALLVGRPPFESCDASDTIRKVMQGEYVLPTGLSEEIIGLLKATMNYNPKERLTIYQILSLPCVMDATCPSNCSQILSYHNIAPPYVKKPQVRIKDPVKRPARASVTEEKTVKKVSMLETDPRYAKVVRQPTGRGKENFDRNAPRSAKKPALVLSKCLNTERLKPITHTTPHGYIKVDSKGFIEMEIDNKAKILRITPNGQKVMVYSKLVEDCNMEYDLNDLPHKLYPAYKYAFDFVNILKSKTPKVVYKSSECKFLLMENEPCHSCELFMGDGTKVIHMISNPKVDIVTPDGRKIRISHMEDYEFLSPEIQKVIDTLFGAIRKCVEVEDLCKLKGATVNFPIVIGPDTDVKALFNKLNQCLISVHVLY
eukprot:TRINITY_DN1541_c0_g1_i1.p1 TRINITY_DN1541_c0_g1~~TRINITY_DN1541_c0_g1_i1.p1  ORF type:complete len:577 (-),score=55.72 TRINITY_DN1541_c0_g1_i1:5153-6883(-)